MRREDAQCFERWLENSGYIPLVCLHHIHEMASHHVEAVAAMRLRFLANMPFVGWIGTPLDAGPGTVVTLFAEEVRSAYATPSATRAQVRDKAKTELIQVGTGSEMLSPSPKDWLVLQSVFAAQAEMARKIVTFARLNTLDNDDIPISTIVNGQLRSGDSLRRQLKMMSGTLAVNITLRADKRIDDPGSMADEFIRDVEGMMDPMASTAADMVHSGLATLGVTQADIKPSSTVGDMLELGLFRTQFRVAAEAAGLSYDDAICVVRPEQIPTWSISNALRSYLPDLPERQGGELTDTHLTCLAAYADVTLVDKRTLEGVRRLRQKDPDLAGILGHIEHLSRIERAAKISER